MFKLIKKYKQRSPYRALNRTTKAAAALKNKIEDLKLEWQKTIQMFSTTFQSLPEKEASERRLKTKKILDEIGKLSLLLDIKLTELSMLYQDKNQLYR
jgi:hypothetical protein